MYMRNKIFKRTSLIVILIVQLIIQEALTQSPNLDCDFEQSLCIWRQGVDDTEDDDDWLIGDQVLAGVFHGVPGGATGRGLRCRGHSDGRIHRVTLFSSVIPCQASAGKLRFLLWKSAVPPTLTICVRSPPIQTGEVKCAQTFSGFLGQGWLTTEIEIPPTFQPIEIVFIAEVISNTDIVAIDKLIYDVHICNIDAIRRRFISPVTPAPLITQSSIAQQLPFDLEQWWKPLGTRSSHLATTSQSSVWTPFVDYAVIETEPTQPSKLSTVSQRRRPTSPPFRSIAVDPSQKTNGTGTNQFRQSSNGGNFRRLQSRLSTTAEPENEPQPQFLDQCRVAECNFEGGLCDFEAVKTGSGDWRVDCQPVRLRDGRLLRAATGKCFAIATSVRGDSSHLFVSRPFFTTVPTVLDFFYYIPVYDEIKNQSLLTICINSFDTCIWERVSPPRMFEQWWKAVIPLPVGRIQLFIIVDQTRRLDFVALDEIRLMTEVGGSSAPCQVYDVIK